MDLKEVKDFYQSLNGVKEAIREFSSTALYELDGGIIEWGRCKKNIYVFLEKQEAFVLAEFSREFPVSINAALRISDFNFSDFSQLLLEHRQLLAGNEEKIWHLVQDVLNYKPGQVRVGKEFLILLTEESLQECIDEELKVKLLENLNEYA